MMKSNSICVKPSPAPVPTHVDTGVYFSPATVLAIKHCRDSNVMDVRKTVIADSACNYGMCGTLEAFNASTFERCRANVEIGDGSNDMLVEWKGRVIFQPEDPDASQFSVMMYYHPDSSFIILPERVFDQGGCKLVKYRSILTVTLPGSSRSEPIFDEYLDQNDLLYHCNVGYVQQPNPPAPVYSMVATTEEGKLDGSRRSSEDGRQLVANSGESKIQISLRLVNRLWTKN